ncbi:MAG: Omp28-related outer membrane protein [bacterium]
MKKEIVLSLLFTAAFSFASERVVVAEEFIRVTCTYCPGAARGLRENHNRSYDSLIVIACHTAAPFNCPAGSQRLSYYGITGVPTVKFDGILTVVGGVSAPGTMYPHYRHHLTTRAAISSPLEIALTCTYDSVSNNGSITATLDNTSGSTVSGTLHFSITENNIPYNWGGGLTTVEHVLRDMLPDANGEAVSIPAGDTIMRSRDYTINGAWNEYNCDIVVFVQGSSHEIYQGAITTLIQDIDMDYYGLTFTELSGNGNGIAEPDETIRMYVSAKNNGTGSYTGTATVYSSDPYITINAINPQTVSISPGEVDTVLSIDALISATCPSPHTWNFQVDFGTGDTNDISFIVSYATGFSDNMESGQGSWTHTGSNDNWHITEHKSNSPTHSWYCGLEGSWQYTDRNDASLISPYFVVTPDSSLSFYHQYGLEANYDYTYAEIDNNCGWWQTLDEYNGYQSTWTQETYSLSNYSGQTARIRFRFISDQNTVAEGWYIDDVFVPNILGVEENKNALQPISLHVLPNPFSHSLNIICNSSEASSLNIYDATGRLIRKFDALAINKSNQISWDALDQNGNRIPNGIYFIKLQSDQKTVTKKVLFVR